MTAQTTGSTKVLKVFVPFEMQKRGGRKLVLAPGSQSDEDHLSKRAPQANALLKAIARAYRWRRQIEDGEFASISELAKACGVNQSYACRLLRLTLLSPALIEEVLSGRLSGSLTLKRALAGFSVVWAEQFS
jgi:hypothetical protein